MATQNKKYKVSPEVVYRSVSGELVLIEVSSGNLYHFSDESRPFFDYFRAPRSLASYLDGVSDPGASERVTELMSMLVEKNILQATDEPSEATASMASFPPPQFLRMGERLESTRFLY